MVYRWNADSSTRRCTPATKILTTRRLQLGYRRRRNAEPIPEEYRIKNERERRREARKARQSRYMLPPVRENKTPQEQPVAGRPAEPSLRTHRLKME